MRNESNTRAHPIGLSILAIAIAMTITAPALAQSEVDGPTARCRHLRALAESQAYLMFSPTVWAEGVHVPRLGDETGAGYVQGGEWQVRASLSLSAIDIVRGTMLLDAASAECRQMESLERARRTIELGESVGELPARRAEREALIAMQARANEIAQRAERMVREGLSTETQLAQVRAETDRLTHRVDQLNGEIERLIEAGHDDADPARLRADLEAYERSAMDLERQRSSVRRLQPWTVQVRAGVVPVDRMDWFGQVQIGFNLGGLAQQVAEDAVLAARQDELSGDAQELRAHVERLERRLALSVRALSAELAHIDRQIALGERQHALLGELETGEIDHVRAMLELQAIGLRAERAHLARLVAVRTAMAGGEESGGEDVEAR